MNGYIRILLITVLLQCTHLLSAEDGYRLWLRYDPVTERPLLRSYTKHIKGLIISDQTATLRAARDELLQGLNGILQIPVPLMQSVTRNGTIVAGTPSGSALIASLNLSDRLEKLGKEGYIITHSAINGKNILVIASVSDIGVLYGVFHFLRLLQSHQDISDLSVECSPRIRLRLLNHWDNLDRTVERGYAGCSLWDWHLLPDYISPRYRDYARANASIGINGTVLTNVNANALVLTKECLQKAAALANVFRPFGIRVFLTARFNAPVETGSLKTADPLDPDVIRWWKNKADEIYTYIPDFGGFLVKANSEGQPGPQDYGRSHADGANMLADALKPHGGVVMWRAFVYDNNVPEDRAKQAYNEFTPLDGKFRSNVLVQVKNGPVDFQPREPFHPLFGAMPATPLMMEFQITQEYLGFATHLVYLGSLYHEFLMSDTYARGKGSTVARVIDGSLESIDLTGMAGVSNTGSERNWTGHPFAQANWYAFGRLAWDPYLDPMKIADEWIRMTFTNNSECVRTILKIMEESREIAVDYMTPLGLHHLMGAGHHYGPGPWVDKGRADWTSVYYHRADSAGIGFDRTSGGSNAVSQYFSAVRDSFENIHTCPEKLLLWFHHLPWNHTLTSGNTLWNELCYHYYSGAERAGSLRILWEQTKEWIDEERFSHVRSLLTIQEKEAKWWRDACVLYFQTFSRKPIPAGLEKPANTLEHYRNLKFFYVPGI